MADTEGAKSPFPRVLKYLRDGFIPHPVDISVNPWILASTKWYFDFVKNTITVGVLFALAKKTNSIPIYSLAWVSFCMLGLYIVHNIHSWHFEPFHGFKNARPRFAHIAGMILWVIFATCLTFGVQYFLITAIYAIVDANTK
jgi:hypothetical protein